MEEDRADHFELERISTQFLVPLSAVRRLLVPSAPQGEQLLDERKTSAMHVMK
jgi:hypothetical protein